jgi:hypothetical protein
MKEIMIKCGTRQEIHDYLKEKVKKTFNRMPEAYPSALHGLKEGDVYEYGFSNIERQILNSILSGSPMVAVVFPIYGGREYYREQFIIEDFAEQKLNLELEIEKSTKREIKINALR